MFIGVVRFAPLGWLLLFYPWAPARILFSLFFWCEVAAAGPIAFVLVPAAIYSSNQLAACFILPVPCLGNVMVPASLRVLVTTV
jgi:hypothetical protein